MSLPLNLFSNLLPGYGSSKGSCFPCLGVSVPASISLCPPESECKTFLVKTLSPNCSLRKVFVCNANSSGYRRNPDYYKKNRNRFSRNRNRLVNERESSESLDESEFLSTNNGPLLSLSNSAKSQPIASPGPREREIVELFRKVQAKLREKAAIKEEKKIESSKGRNNESDKTVDSLLNLLRKHSVEQGKRTSNVGNDNEFNLGRSRENRPSHDDSTQPPSNFRRRSPISRVRYEPNSSTKENINYVSHLDVNGKTSKLHSEPDMDMVSVLETELQPKTNIVESHEASELSDIDEDKSDADTERQHIEVKHLNAMKLAELRALAKSRGIKGFSKLKKAELLGLLSEDPI